MDDPPPLHAVTESAAAASAAISRMRFAFSLFMTAKHSFMLEETLILVRLYDGKREQRCIGDGG